MTIFDEAKSRLDIMEAAEFYGLNVNRHKKALCPFHDDNNPSLNFKNGRFTCFSCNASGDIISLTRQLFGLSSPLEAVKRLNNDFHLGLSIGSSQTAKDASQYRKDKALVEAFAKWEKETFVELAGVHRLLLQYRIDYVPTSMGEPPDQRFATSLKMVDYVDYLCDILTLGTNEEKIKMYKDWGK